MEMTMKWQEGLSFTGSNPSGQEVYISNEKDEQGKRTGFSPIQLLALGLGTCSGMDVVSIMQKKRQEIQDFDVKVNYERRKEHPTIWSEVNVQYIVTGKEIDPAALERSIQLSVENYCAAYGMLSKSVEITTSYKIIEA